MGRQKTDEWLRFFDVVIVGCSKPGFFSERRPLFAVNTNNGSLQNTDNGAPTIPIGEEDLPAEGVRGGRGAEGRREGGEKGRGGGREGGGRQGREGGRRCWVYLLRNLYRTARQLDLLGVLGPCSMRAGLWWESVFIVSLAKQGFECFVQS